MIILSDRFIDLNGTPLESHIPDIGLWLRRSVGDPAEIQNFAMTNANYQASYYYVNMPPLLDMSVQFTVVTKGIEPLCFLCRMSISDPLDAYGLLYAGTFSDDTIWQFILYNNGSIVVLKTFAMPTIAGDIVKFEVVANTLNCYLNGVIFDTINHSLLTTGLAGFRYPSWNGTVSLWDNALIEAPFIPHVDHLPLIGLH